MPHTHTTDETEKKKKKTHNPFKIIKNKIMGLGHKKHKKKSEKTTTHTAPSHLASHTIQRITPPPIKPTASMLMAEHPLEMEQIISSPLPLTTSQTSEKSSPHHPQTKTVSSLSAPVLIPTLTTASSLPDPEKASHTVTESEQATHIPPKKSNVSEWDFSALPEEEEALDQIPLQAHKLITKAEPSRASQINTALETYVPGWRLLMHSVFEPMVQHNIEASDAWVEKLAGFLPSASDTPSLLVPQPLGFLPYSISLVPEETQKIDESEDASMTHQTKAVLKR
ncbi:hypothetical protein CC99x_001110 [Candidatus Berkiella cookevillensis]|uniref:Uncharacterized protein n=1 Tax=Candidatus Berkiella cookevillensis TaxID=437022 RepID=A0A0Q9YQ54_9GAMM|nr:hypothetical protein [Candidatus Berkiella cookevillensis]MCS5707495.1 hypothetical protein [Candidatus Berkiella cookevillensis]